MKLPTQLFKLFDCFAYIIVMPHHYAFPLLQSKTSPPSCGGIQIDILFALEILKVPL
jgi:hypothetical protein